MQHTDGALPAEYDDGGFLREVLQLDEGQTEAAFDEDITKEAERLGITISRPPTPNQDAHISMCESALTVQSQHARTASSGSQGSNSTGMTSRSSNENLDHLAPMQTRKRSNTRRSLSFSDYEKYLNHYALQTSSSIIPPPIPNEPAPSLFSVSTRRSYQSIRNGFKTRFRLRRNKPSKDDLR